MSTFRKELEELINRHSKENESSTPDFILAGYLTGCLEVFTITTKERAKWYGLVAGQGFEQSAPPVDDSHLTTKTHPNMR